MLSVIIPIYNLSKIIIKCLESMENQTLESIEFIIIDDGSTDDSYQICSDFIKDKPKFKLIYKENGGITSAWTEGLKHVKGNYVGFIDGDDYAQPDMFMQLYSAAIENDADIVMCDHYVRFADNFKIQKSKLEPGLYTQSNISKVHDRVFTDQEFKKVSNARWNKIYKTELYKSNTVYNKELIRLCEDRFIVPACMMSASKFVYIDKPLYNYVQWMSAISISLKPELYAVLKKLLKSQEDMLKDKNLYKKYGDNLDRSIIEHFQILIYRNLRAKGNYKVKLSTIKNIQSDKKYQEILKKYGKHLSNRDRVLLKSIYFVRIPAVVLLINELIFVLNRVYTVLRKKNVRLTLID